MNKIEQGDYRSDIENFVNKTFEDLESEYQISEILESVENGVKILKEDEIQRILKDFEALNIRISKKQNRKPNQNELEQYNDLANELSKLLAVFCQKNQKENYQRTSLSGVA